MDYVKDKGDPEILNSVGAMIKAFSPVGNLVETAPSLSRFIIEEYANKTAIGFPIVPEQKQTNPDLSGREKYSAYTRPGFKALGDVLNVSPARMQHSVESLFGGWADIAQSIADEFVPEKYQKQEWEQGASIRKVPVLKRFFGGERVSKLKYLESLDKRITYYQKQISATESTEDISEESRLETLAKLYEKLNDVLSELSMGE